MRYLCDIIPSYGIKFNGERVSEISYDLYRMCKALN